LSFFQDSLRNSLGLNIITDCLSLSKLELNPRANQWIGKFIEIILAFPQNVIYKHEIEVIIETLKIHEQMISLIPEVEELIIAEREIIGKINEENINLYFSKQFFFIFFHKCFHLILKKSFWRFNFNIFLYYLSVF
jgi:hypothetical protein